jgi:hypothetical protein
MKTPKTPIKKTAYKTTFKETGQGLFNPNIKQYTKTQVKQAGDKTIKNTITTSKDSKTGKTVGNATKKTAVVVNNKKGVYTKKAGYTNKQHSGLGFGLDFYTKESTKSKSYKKKS